MVHALPQINTINTKLVCKFGIPLGRNTLQVLPFCLNVRNDANELHFDSNRADFEGNLDHWHKNSSFFHPFHARNIGIDPHFHRKEIRTGVRRRARRNLGDKKGRVIEIKLTLFVIFLTAKVKKR